MIKIMIKKKRNEEKQVKKIQKQIIKKRINIKLILLIQKKIKVKQII